MNELKSSTFENHYEGDRMRQFVRDLVTWSKQFTAPLDMAVRIIDASQLPTVTDLAALPSGAVYNDSGVLKVKP